MSAQVLTAPEQDQLAPFRETPIRLFIRDQGFRAQIQQILEKHLKFKNVVAVATGQAAADTIEKLSRLLLTEEAQVLFSPPPSTGKDAADNRVDALRQFLLNVQARMRQTGKESEKILKGMSKLVPVFEEAENYQMRMKYLMTLAEFRITNAFILPYAQSAQPKEQEAERIPLLRQLLLEHFTEKEKRFEDLEQRKNEADLSTRKAQAEKLMKQGEDYKRSGNWEEAVQCFNKAIDAMPDDPGLYLESGRGYTKLKKYSRAIQRFTEAEEVADGIPAPNQEIANVRIIQVKEMIAQGADPDSEQVAKLMGEAVANYKSAIAKAEALIPHSPGDTTDRAAEAVSNIASGIFKHELAETLGSRNAMVKELGAIARRSLENAVKDASSVSLPTSQLICLALASVDKGEFAEAETLLFRAAEDKKYLLEACRELNYMGTQVRKANGPGEAIQLYMKILALDPPNKAAVHYNLAVARHAKGDLVEAAGSIVEAVYTDPSLPTHDLFYKNAEVVHLMETLVGLFSRIKENDGKIPAPSAMPVPPDAPLERAPMFTPVDDPQFAAHRLRFEILIKQERQKAYRILYDLYTKCPAFLQSASAYASAPIMGLMEEMEEKINVAEKEELKQLAIFLKEVLRADAALLLPDGETHAPLRRQLEALIPADQNAAVKKLFETAAGDRGFFATRQAFECGPLAALARSTVQKLATLADPRFAIFTSALQRYIQRRERYLHAAVSPATANPLDAALQAGPGALFDLLEIDPALLDSPEAYDNESLNAFARNVDAGAAPLLAARLNEYAGRRERYLQFAKYANEAIEVLMATSDQRKMANSIAKAIYAMPEVVDKYYFYQHGDIVSASKEICMKLQGLALRHL